VRRTCSSEAATGLSRAELLRSSIYSGRFAAPMAGFRVSICQPAVLHLRCAPAHAAGYQMDALRALWGVAGGAALAGAPAAPGGLSGPLWGPLAWVTVS